MVVRVIRDIARSVDTNHSASPADLASQLRMGQAFDIGLTPFLAEQRKLNLALAYPLLTKGYRKERLTMTFRTGWQ